MNTKNLIKLASVALILLAILSACAPAWAKPVSGQAQPGPSLIHIDQVIWNGTQFGPMDARVYDITQHVDPDPGNSINSSTDRQDGLAISSQVLDQVRLIEELAISTMLWIGRSAPKSQSSDGTIQLVTPIRAIHSLPQPDDLVIDLSQGDEVHLTISRLDGDLSSDEQAFFNGSYAFEAQVTGYGMYQLSISDIQDGSGSTLHVSGDTLIEGMMRQVEFSWHASRSLPQDAPAKTGIELAALKTPTATGDQTTQAKDKPTNINDINSWFCLKILHHNHYDYVPMGGY